ncbi:MAG: hypothetical protein ACK5VI_03650 [Opitutia bacterium]
MTIYLVIDYGQYEGMDVKEYVRAIDALRELNQRERHSSNPVTQIIHGQQLTKDELRHLVKAEAKKKEPHKCV